jgi:hypothetical protein
MITDNNGSRQIEVRINATGTLFIIVTPIYNNEKKITQALPR